MKEERRLYRNLTFLFPFEEFGELPSSLCFFTAVMLVPLNCISITQKKLMLILRARVGRPHEARLSPIRFVSCLSSSISFHGSVFRTVAFLSEVTGPRNHDSP
jgi:hypothetical protein